MKKRYFLLLVIICVGYLMPIDAFSKETIRNFKYDIDVDSKFQIENNNSSNLNFILYDETNTFNFSSSYNPLTNNYYFYASSDNDFSSYNRDLFNYLSTITYSDDRDGTWCHYPKILNFDMIRSFNFETQGGDSYIPNGQEYDNFSSAYSIIPLILEETTGTNYKKIIYATIHLIIYDYCDPYNDNVNYYIEFTLVNDNEHEKTYPDFNTALYFGHNINHIIYYRWNGTLRKNKNVDNIAFMTNAIYDYSDGLWEALNSSKIASSEVNDFVEDYYNNTDKTIYSKYESNINYRFKVNNGNGMKFTLHDLNNTFSFNSNYDKASDTYSIVDNSSDSGYQEGIKNFSKIIIDEIKDGNFSNLSTKYRSITSNNCSNNNCHIYTYMPLILEGESGTKFAKRIVVGLLDVTYKKESGKDYYDISLNLYNNTCELMNSNIDADMNELINLSRAIEEEYSNSLIDKYSNGSTALDDIYTDVDVNTLKDEYCKNVPVISLRQNPKTFTNGVYILILILIIVSGCTVIILKRKKKKM